MNMLGDGQPFELKSLTDNLGLATLKSKRLSLKSDHSTNRTHKGLQHMNFELYEAKEAVKRPREIRH